MHLLPTFATPIALLSTQLGLAVPTPQPSYDLALTIQYDDRMLGTPRLHLVEGEPASIETTGPDGYSLHVTLTRVARGTGTVARLETELYVARAGKWVHVASPLVTAPFGTNASFEAPRSGSRPSLRITYAIGMPIAASQ